MEEEVVIYFLRPRRNLSIQAVVLVLYIVIVVNYLQIRKGTHDGHGAIPLSSQMFTGFGPHVSLALTWYSTWYIFFRI